MNLKLLVSSVTLMTSKGSLEDVLMLLLPAFDLLGRLSMNFYLYSQTEVYNFNIVEKCIRPVSELCICKVVKLGTSLGQITSGIWVGAQNQKCPIRDRKCSKSKNNREGLNMFKQMKLKEKRNKSTYQYTNKSLFMQNFKSLFLAVSPAIAMN